MTTPSKSELMQRAENVTGLSDWGDLPFEEGLEIYLWSLTHESGHGSDAVRRMAEGLVPTLVKRLRLVNDRSNNPAIADEEIVAPIVIIGLPRTGSTHLHALMATRTGSRAPLQWEMNEPSPPPEAATFDTDPRIAAVQFALEARPNHEELMAIHPFGAQRPEQCIGLIDWSFVNSGILASNYLPSYFAWFLSVDQRPAYEHHKRMMQQLQWHNPGEWVLKWPKHVFALDALLDTYPDARIVWTHRDPGTVVPSVCDFVGTIRRMVSPIYDAARFGKEWSALEEMGLLRAMAVREQVADESRFYDLHYNDLMRDPVGAIAGIHEHFGTSFDEKSRSAVANFQRDNPQDKHGRHTYTAEQYGLETSTLRRRFAPYIDRFNVEPDAPRGK